MSSEILRDDLQAFGVLPLYLIAGGVATGAALTRFLESDEWSAGEYNNWMLKIDQTLHEWDKLGWSGCWQKHPAKRTQFLDLWARFSKHYKEHGRITSGVVTDSEEKPARDILRDLATLGDWLNKNCGVDTGSSLNPSLPEPPPPADGGLANYLKWGAIAIGGLVALNVVSSLRDIFPRRRY